MLELAELLFKICVFKKAPQDIPYSMWLFKLLLFANVASNFLLATMDTFWFYALLKALLSTLMLSLFSWLCLYFNGKVNRFCQTSCALWGTDAIITLLAVPANASAILQQGELLVFFAMVSLMIWSWLIIGHIMRHALQQSFSFCVGLTFLYLLVSYQVTTFIF